MLITEEAQVGNIYIHVHWLHGFSITISLSRQLEPTKLMLMHDFQQCVCCVIDSQ